MSRSTFGGRHELGQNFLVHQPTLKLITALVAESRGTILELGAGDGALTSRLAGLRRPVRAIEIDEHRAARLAGRLHTVDVVHDDALTSALDADVIVGNVPFHLTTPILRRLLADDRWHTAVLLTQWEVARKRAGVGGSTLMTATNAPWFEFFLEGRVPSRHFRPVPAVDGGLLRIERRRDPLVPVCERRPYAGFVRAVFTGRGARMAQIVRNACGLDAAAAGRALDRAGVAPGALPRDLDAGQWAGLWTGVARPSAQRRTSRSPRPRRPGARGAQGARQPSARKRPRGDARH